MKKLSDNKELLMKISGAASVTVAGILLLIKFFAWARTDSVSIFASFIDSGMDVLASLINLVAIRYALIPPDNEHRYGHGKAEAIAGLAQACFIGGSACILLLNAFNRVAHPVELQNLPIGIGVMLVSLSLTLLLVVFQRYVVRRTNSMAVKADSLHYLTDILANAATLAALFMALLGWPRLDVIVGVLVGLYILKSAWDIVIEALNVLLDRELPDEKKEAIAAVIRSHADVKGFHDLRTRQSGLYSYIQFHLELGDALSLLEAHELSEVVEESLKKAFPDMEALIHIDPESPYKGGEGRREGFVD